MISARGNSWEGLRYGTSKIFDTKKAAITCVAERIERDEEEYLERQKAADEDGETEHDGDEGTANDALGDA